MIGKSSAWLLLILVTVVVLGACSSGRRRGGGGEMYGRQELPTFVKDTAPYEDGRDYIIGVGDRLDIVFVYNKELNSHDVPVRPDGKISVHHVGDIVAAGLTPMELDSMLTERFAEILREPSLSVVLMKEAKRKVYVLGDVRQPGGYLYEGQISLLQAIAEAGGFIDGAKPQNTVLIRRAGPDKIVGIEIDVKAIMKGSALGNDILLRKYDIVYVPRSRIQSVVQFSRDVTTILQPAMMGWQIRALYASYDFYTSGGAE